MTNSKKVSVLVLLLMYIVFGVRVADAAKNQRPIVDNHTDSKHDVFAVFRNRVKHKIVKSHSNESRSVKSSNASSTIKNKTVGGWGSQYFSKQSTKKIIKNN